MRIGRSFRFRRIKPSHFVGDVQRVCPGNSWEQAGSRQQCPAPDRLHVSGLDFQGWRADGWFGAFCLEMGASLKGGRSQETCLLPCFSLLPSTPVNCLEWYIFFAYGDLCINRKLFPSCQCQFGTHLCCQKSPFYVGSPFRCPNTVWLIWPAREKREG